MIGTVEMKHWTSEGKHARGDSDCLMVLLVVRLTT